MTRRLSGHCSCGVVAFHVQDDFLYSVICHCSGCRHATGAASKPFAGIEREKLALTTGTDHVLIVGGGPTHDVRCKTCGSLLYSVVREGEFVHVALGSLADAPKIRPSAHIFVGSKAEWEVIADGLPQYSGHVVSDS